MTARTFDFIPFIQRLNALLILAGNCFQHVLLLLFRLYWGTLFFETGHGKLIHHKDVASFFASLHIPAPGINAWFVGGLEYIGGLLLLIGLASRPIGFLLSCNMLVAYLAVDDDRHKLFNIFQNPEAFLSADQFFFLLTSLLVFCFGAGIFSADWLISKFTSKRRASAS